MITTRSWEERRLASERVWVEIRRRIEALIDEIQPRLAEERNAW